MSMIHKSQKLKAQKYIRKLRQALPYASLQQTATTGLKVRIWLSKNRTFFYYLKQYLEAHQILEVIKFLKTGTEELDIELLFYLKHVSDYRSYIRFVMPLIAMHMKNKGFQDRVLTSKIPEQIYRIVEEGYIIKSVLGIYRFNFISAYLEGFSSRELDPTNGPRTLGECKKLLKKAYQYPDQKQSHLLSQEH